MEQGYSKHCAHKARSLQVCLVLFMSFVAVDAGRFAVQGPIVTLTLKDPNPSSLALTSNDECKWFDLQSLRPNLLWSLQSLSKPLPNWLPSLQLLRANVGYNYEELRRLPSFVEADLRFSTANPLASRFGRATGNAIDVEVQPSYELQPHRGVLLIQVSQGASYIKARFASKGQRWLEVIKGCYRKDLQFASIGAIRIAPAYDLRTQRPSCLLEGTTGSLRTTALLNVNSNNPTLTFIHALDDRHVISPEISLRTARITYQWSVALRSGSIKAVIDPTSVAHVTWTDQSLTGKWVTDVRLPLEGTTRSAWAANVRVRRQFTF